MKPIIEKKSQIPPLLKDTMSMLNRMKKDSKKSTPDEERSILMESVFKISSIYLDIKFQQSLIIEDPKAKQDSLESCLDWYKEFEAKLI